MVQTNYDKIMRYFIIGEFYNKKEVIDKFEEIGVLKKRSGLIGKLINEFKLNKTYQNGEYALKFIYDKGLRKYRLIGGKNSF